MSAGISESMPAIVLGGTGYVAGELLRLLAGHPRLAVAAVLSDSRSGGGVEAAFPHLAGCYPGMAFSGREEIVRLMGERLTGEQPAAVLCAAPHGAAAPLLDELLTAAGRAGSEVKVVDVSADFRFAAGAAYEAVYGHPHGAPDRLGEFVCALPEHLTGTPAGHVGHPGCFVTATLLAAVPLLKLGLVEPRLSVVAVTGSTGAGRKPADSTHHPARRSNLFAYSPLQHRHEPEMRALAAAASGVEAEIFFTPQAGPFARGIYATLQARLVRPMATEEVRQALAGFYAGAPFVDVTPEPPRLQDVVGTNRAKLSVAVSGDQLGDHLVVLSAIDNLVKGAAGGAIQWMNRLLGFPETAGLMTPGLGWL
jgi:N-acetyl-gamma-glutamyl-phosphate reductase common form